MLSEERRCRLHTRVRSFIEASVSGRVPAESFDELGVAILTYQAENVPAYQRLLARSGRHPADGADIRALPAMPSEAFRLARIAAHPPSDDVVVFRTSGTTAAARGEQALSTTATYECSVIAWGRWALFFDEPKPLGAILLAPRDNPDSSLHFMLQRFAARFASSTHYMQTTATSPIGASALERVCEGAWRAGVPAIIMGTSFA